MPLSRKILVIKHGALGDIVQGIDGFASLRKGHRDDHLAILTSAPFGGFVSMMPYFDEVLIDRRAGIFNFPEHWRIRRILKRDWARVYDFQSSRRTRRYLDRIVNDGTEIIGDSERAIVPFPDMTGINNAERMVMTAALGGCERVFADMSWLTGKAATHDECESGAQKHAVLVPGCSPSNLHKRWPPEHFALLAAMLAGQGYAVKLVGTDADRDAGEVICARLKDTENLMGRTGLPELAGIFATADMVIGNDTGPVFLAAKTGTPTLMLMSGHTDPAMSAPVGARTHWLRADDIAAITPDAVFEAVMQLAGQTVT